MIRDFLRKRASQLSVGQAQRVLIAMAIMHRPALLIADEATSALDVITQSEILELFARLNREIGMSILYISHDLPSVAGICQRIAILHEGQIVECGPTEQIFTAPVHAYTRRLMSALPQVPVRREVLLARAHAATHGVAIAGCGVSADGLEQTESDALATYALASCSATSGSSAACHASKPPATLITLRWPARSSKLQAIMLRYPLLQ